MLCELRRNLQLQFYNYRVKLKFSSRLKMKVLFILSVLVFFAYAQNVEVSNTEREDLQVTTDASADQEDLTRDKRDYERRFGHKKRKGNKYGGYGKTKFLIQQIKIISSF